MRPLNVSPASGHDRDRIRGRPDNDQGVPEAVKIYIAIDMKSFYASVECVSRGYDPLKANLLVADPSRSDKTICLAVSPALKAIGVPGRPRLFEAKQAIRQYELQHRTRVRYEIAVPRMAEYERVSAQIYSIYLRYAAPEDIHVYSIDEVFIDSTPYLPFYQAEARRQSLESGCTVHPSHVMAMTIIRDVLRTTGITATVGIGTNLYLAKVAMDIVAKKASPDKDGVRIAELNESSYCFLLWGHQPLSDFWQIGPRKMRRLHGYQLYTMGEIAARSQWDEGLFYKEFGIDGEILIDHAWGIEPVTMADIKGYVEKYGSEEQKASFAFISKRSVDEDGEYCEPQSFFQIKTWFLNEFPEFKQIRKDYRQKIVSIYDAAYAKKSA